jgi:hypothetical protein
MKHQTEKFLNVIAAMNFREKDLRDILSDIKLTPDSILIRRIMSAQIALHGGGGGLFDDDRSATVFRAASDGGDVTVGDRVSRLLKVEAGLTTSRAMEELIDFFLANDLIARKDIPSLSKKSLADWVDRLSVNIKEKDLLRVATIIRNKFVHGPVSDWNLSRK